MQLVDGGSLYQLFFFVRILESDIRKWCYIYFSHTIFLLSVHFCLISYLNYVLYLSD